MFSLCPVAFKAALGGSTIGAVEDGASAPADRPCRSPAPLPTHSPEAIFRPGMHASRASRSHVNPRERVEKLSHLLRERFPGIAVEVDPPSKPNGDWIVDTKLGDQSFVIEF